MKQITSALFLLLSFWSYSAVYSQDQAVKLICEYKTNPIGIEVSKPRLSWQIQSNRENVTQRAYEIRVAESPTSLRKGKKLLWTTKKVLSNQSIQLAYGGPDLTSMQRVYWQVRVWTQDRPSDWSEVAFWEMGLLEEEAWKASWITKEGEIQGKESLPAHYYRAQFDAPKKIKQARVHLTSLGLYQLYINGQKISDDLFTPGYTSYHKRLQYQSYDVTEIIQAKNAIGAIVGDGWYRGFLGYRGERNFYGDKLGLLVQLHIDYADGSSETIITDTNWKVANGPIIQSDIYNGETYDSNLERDGWSTYGYDDGDWKSAVILDHPKNRLVASQGLPVRATQEITPIDMFTTPEGDTVLDLGQNIVGWVRMKVSGAKGDKVTLQFAEVLDKEGNFYTTNLRAAKATDRYILKGGQEEIFEPHFTFHGFRYVKVSGYPGRLSPDNITGVVIHSDMPSTGSFACSDSLINKLQENIRWGQRGNFLDVPTDCPQRDERLGWTGDAQVFSPTAAFNFDVAAFYTKWLRDLAVDQSKNGSVPHVIPDNQHGRGGATGWGDAAVIVPWTVYQAYGDIRILEEQYPSMKAWVDFMQFKAGEDFLWNNPKDWHWGDWLAFHSSKPDYAGSVTEKDLIATAYYHYSTTLLSKTAKLIGRSEEAETYRQLAERIKEAFTAEFITPNGRLVSHTQTAYALAISFDLIPEDLLQKAATYFANDVEKFGHLTTGFLGTPLLCSSLSKIGRDDLAFMLLHRKRFPSWLYPVTQGATTIWERWDTQKPDGSIIKGMNSFNHYAYGAIGEWLYTHVAGLGIDPEQPGYQHIHFHPHPGPGLSHAKAEFMSMYGEVMSAWEIKDEVLNYVIKIPPNTRGTVTLPNATLAQVTMNQEPLSSLTQHQATQKNDQVALTLGSGAYTFEYPLDKKE